MYYAAAEAVAMRAVACDVVQCPGSTTDRLANVPDDDPGPLGCELPAQQRSNWRQTHLISMHSRSEEQRDDLVEQVAQEIQLRGWTAPAVLFMQASRPYRPLGSSAMVFFDPTLRDVFGGDLPVATQILADDLGIEQLIERLQDPDEEISWDA